MTVNTRKLSDLELSTQYTLIKSFYDRFLSDKGVNLPGLYRGNEYTSGALVLIFLSLGYPATEVVSKEELTTFIRHYKPNVNDVQEGRHLAAQKGFYIASGRRNDVHRVPDGCYKLITLEEPYPGFMQERRFSESLDWEGLKAEYDYRCATCGSKEGELSFRWPARITVLEKAHMDPNMELTDDNAIPQCSACNRGDRNRWVYDRKGRVISVANPAVITSCDEDVQFEVYKLLYKKYRGINPL